METGNALPLVLTIRQACDALTISRATLFKMFRRGDIRTVKIGDRTLVRCADIQAFLEQSAGNNHANQ